MRTRVRKAFTLVEILIVVVILGILAAIVVPQFTNATQDAQAGNIMTQLDTINNQIELFAARNNGLYPGQTAAETPAGAFDNAAGAWTEMLSQSYLKSAPSNPACPGTPAQRTAVAVGAPVATAGWNWDVISATNPTYTMRASFFDEDPASATYGEITPGVP
jgi:prepilin-type N-terminal cleavage/methylation domain-containing protein